MDAKSAIIRYCSYQPRCHQEVRNKLYEIGCKAREVEELIAWLIEIDLLNEERYARSVSRGKFRMLGWGRNKIIQKLRQHKVSEYCIRKGLQEIDEEEYNRTFSKTAMKKWTELKGEKNIFIKKQKLSSYLQQKGFETTLIHEWLKQSS